MYYNDLLSYDENGLLIQNLDQDWDTISGWVDDYKEDYTYDENGNQLSERGYNWRSDSMVWEPYRFVEYKYDVKNQLILRKSNYWNYEKQNWYASDSLIYEYDAGGNNVLKQDFYWDSYFAVWYPGSKYTYGYDIQNNLISEHYYWYNNELETYSEQRKTVYSFDLSYKKEEVLMPFDRGAESLLELDGGGSEYDYVKEGMILSIIESELINGNKNLQETNRETFYYSGTGMLRDDARLTVPELQLYPNPASSTLYVTLGDETDSRIDIKVFDLNGKVLIIKDLSHNRSIDISSLKQGIFLIQIQTGKKLYTRKFIKSAL